MAPLRFIAVVVALLGLSACYTSTTPLIGDDAVAQYAKVSFRGEDADAKPVTFTRDGNGYVTESDDGEEVRLYLKPIEGEFYVAQLSGPGSDGATQYLYGYLRLDAAAKVADAWMTVGSGDDVRPGLSECDGVICVGDLAAYISYAQERIAGGEEPDTSFEFIAE